MADERTLKFEIFIDGKKAIAEVKNFGQVVKNVARQVDKAFQSNQRSVDELKDYQFRTNRITKEDYVKHLKARLQTLKQETAAEQLEYARLQDKIKEVNATAGNPSGIKNMFSQLKQNWVELTAIVGGSLLLVRELVQAAGEVEASQRKLLAASRLTGIGYGELATTAKQVREEYKLNTQQANELTIELSKLGQKAGDVSKTGDAIGRLLDLATAQGLSAEEALTAIHQAILGMDEGTDKLFQKNPSVLYEEYAAKIGTTAGKLTDQQKAQALLNGVMEYGARVQGEYNKFLQTSIGLQSQQAALTQELAAQFGALLNDILIPLRMIWNNLLEQFIRMPHTLKQLTIAVFGTVAVLRVLSAVLAGFSVTLGPSSWLIAGIGLLATAFGLLQINAGDATDEMQKFRTELNALSVEQARKQLVELEAELKKAKEEAANAAFKSKGEIVFEGIPSEQITPAMQQFAVNLDKKFGAVNNIVEGRVKELEQKIAETKAHIEKLQGVKIELPKAGATNAIKQFDKQLQQRIEAFKTAMNQEAQATLAAEHRKLDYMAQTGRLSLEQFRDILVERLKYVRDFYGAESQEYMQLQDRIAQINREILNGQRNFINAMQALVETNWGAITQNVVDFEASGKEKRERIWEAMKRNFVLNQLEMLKAFIFSEKTKEAFKKKNVALMLGHYAKEAAGAVASAGKTIASVLSKAGAFIMEAAAKIYASFASIPFGLGIPAAAAVIAGMVAAFKGLRKVLAFATGGKVEKPTLGLVGEAGTEIIAPEKDALTVMREMAAQVLADVRAVMLERQAVQVAVAGVGGNVQMGLLEEVRDLLDGIYRKESKVVVENRISGRELRQVIQKDESMDTYRRLR